jgi:nicotianamine synthase
MEFACEDVSQENTIEWGECEVVFLAALVGGDSRHKIGILEKMAGKLRKGTLIVARSARGLREVLYPVCILDCLFGRETNDVLGS